VATVEGHSDGVRYQAPAAWVDVPARVDANGDPVSAGLRAVRRGSTDTPGCPAPFWLLRSAKVPPSDLGLATAFYNHLQATEHPGRVIGSQRRVALTGFDEAVLITATFPGASGLTVTTYDLLGRTAAGHDVHLFAAGCAADLGDDFVDQAVLSVGAS
jgi:hypothetical protein